MTQSSSYRRVLSKMGYYAYQDGLIHNHLSQQGGWDSHLKRCRNFIMKALDYHKPSVVTVLGSGWLLDLPLAEMLERIQKIYLVDIIHPPEVIRQAGELGKVEIIDQDITGGLIGKIWSTTRKISFFSKLKSISSVIVPEYVPSFDPGMVISLNILTQLESRLIGWLKRKSDVGEEEMMQFRKGLQEKHIAFLKKNKTVLITDYAEVVSKKSGEIISVPTLLTSVPDGLFREEWTWDFDLKGRESFNSISVIKMVAVTF